MPALRKIGKAVLRAGRDRSWYIWEEKTAEVILLFFYALMIKAVLSGPYL